MSIGNGIVSAGNSMLGNINRPQTATQFDNKHLRRWTIHVVYGISTPYDFQESQEP